MTLGRWTNCVHNPFIPDLGVIPIIRCPRSGAAEMLAKKLDSRLRDHVMNSRNNLFSDSNTMNFQRPVLVILDRNMDLVPILSHSWTYQALVHDVMDMKLNEIVIQVICGIPRRFSFCHDGLAMS